VVVSNKDIAQAVLQMSKSASMTQVTSALASFLVSERRSKDLGAIMREVSRLRQKHSGINEANVTSAFDLNEDLIGQIRQIIGGQTVIINQIIDKSLIGGVRVETNDSLLDLTVRNRLDQLKRSAKTV
jgi:F-type H+-transporting ATPase subunit delta